MASELETISYQQSFHGPFSSANAAVQLITQRIDSSREKRENSGRKNSSWLLAFVPEARSTIGHLHLVRHPKPSTNRGRKKTQGMGNAEKLMHQIMELKFTAKSLQRQARKCE
ncbi:hypothetical protein HPP92_010476 [Vanilla planifolia]|uniref:Uncharacterized protein n=1 Tax=Vanilla planifolia TaxID=51239 RepID=A0A835V1V5_VANPL|nr:hypothetical protein HPP92_010476 [Vanilla planifolia]